MSLTIPILPLNPIIAPWGYLLSQTRYVRELRRFLLVFVIIYTNIQWNPNSVSVIDGHLLLMILVP